MIDCTLCRYWCPDTGYCNNLHTKKDIKDYEAGLYPVSCDFKEVGFDKEVIKSKSEI